MVEENLGGGMDGGAVGSLHLSKEPVQPKLTMARVRVLQSSE